MNNETLSVQQLEKRIIDKTKVFIDWMGTADSCLVDMIGENKLIYKKNTKKKDYLNKIIKNLQNTKEILDNELKNRSSEELLDIVKNTSSGLEKILQNLKEQEKVGKKSKDGSTLIYVKSLLSFDDFPTQTKHNLFQFKKVDIYILAYYELINIYKKNGIIKDFKTKAIELLNQKFKYSLKGNNLEVSLLKIHNDSISLEIGTEEYENIKTNQKLKFPTFSTSI